MKKYVQFGCGLSAPTDWINFDASPTLRIQRNPILRMLFQRKLNVKFPSNVLYGDITKGLPVDESSCDGLYCSHVLEHLSYEDFIKSLNHSYKILKPMGTFRLVMPDLEKLISNYYEAKKSGNKSAAVKFIRDSGMGLDKRSKGIRSFFESWFGNSKHLWLWDIDSAIEELTKAGFKNIRVCYFNDSKDPMFKLVEDESRFKSAIALEMSK